MRATLAATVIAKNEQDRLPGTLAALSFVDELVVVVDAATRDATARLAEEAGARVFVREFEGFGAQKNFAASRCASDWVLSVDADELVTPSLAREIRTALDAPQPALPSAYRVPIRLEFLGRALLHGRDTLVKPARLYRRDRARFSGARVHERLLVDGPVGSLSGFMLHRSYRDLSHYLEKVDLYTTLAAEAKQSTDSLSLRLASGGSRRLLPLRFLWELVDRGLLRAAFLDGREGLAFAALSACYTLIKYLKVAELAGGARELSGRSQPFPTVP